MNQQEASGGLEEFSLWVPKEYVMAGYPTLLEFQFMTADRPQFALGTGTEISDIRIQFTKWVLESRLVRACEEGEDYRFGFNGQEKVNEVAGMGNHYTAFFGEYDPRIIWRWNRDPKPVAWESPYAMYRGNPIWNSDPLLDSAWAINNQWDGKMMEKYQKDAPGIIKELEKSGQKFTCDDLALTTVMTFARDNNLPFKWETGSGTFDAASDKYTDFGTFKQDVLSHSGAPDFQRGNNAFPVSKNGMFAGGLILHDRRSSGTAHHVQVVTRVASAYSVAAQARQNIALVIKQGNFNGLGRYLGSDNPQSLRYLGTPIQTGLYDLMNDEYTNFSTGGTPQRNFSQGADRLEFRLFNFSNWNK